MNADEDGRIRQFRSPVAGHPFQAPEQTAAEVADIIGPGAEVVVFDFFKHRRDAYFGASDGIGRREAFRQGGVDGLPEHRVFQHLQVRGEERIVLQGFQTGFFGLEGFIERLGPDPVSPFPEKTGGAGGLSLDGADGFA
jgi:hypothetical protein